jgi:hypothetical protein
MFKVPSRRFNDPSRQIPYTLYESLQEYAPHRRVRALLQVLLVAAAVLGLAFGTAAGYKHFSNSKQADLPQTNTQPTQKNENNTDATKQNGQPQAGSKAPSHTSPSVTQAPQVNKNTAAPTTKPSVTSESHTTNTGTVKRPD